MLKVAGAGYLLYLAWVGKPCPITARPSGFCHVHGPAVLCGAPTKRGTACGVATGGGRCRTHKQMTTVVEVLDH